LVIISAGLLLLATVAAAPSITEGLRGCPATNGDQIFVCGSRTGRSPYRLPKLPERYESNRIRAETDAIPGVHTRAHIDSSVRSDGYQDNRAMVTFSLPF